MTCQYDPKPPERLYAFRFKNWQENVKHELASSIPDISISHTLLKRGAEHVADVLARIEAAQQFLDLQKDTRDAARRVLGEPEKPRDARSYAIDPR